MILFALIVIAMTTIAALTALVVIFVLPTKPAHRRKIIP